MKITAPLDWQLLNQQYLAAALENIRTALQRHVAEPGTAEVEDLPEPEDLSAIANTLPASPALLTLCTAFNLTPFERDVLLLCAGVELSASLAHLCATAQGDPHFTYPTFSLALAALPNDHWSALAPSAPLRHWRLIELGTGESLTQGRLRIDERILHYLTGVSYLDDRLQGLVEPLSESLPPLADLPPSHQRVAEQIRHLWTQTGQGQRLPVIQLCGNARDDKGAIAAAACAAVGMSMYTMRAIDIPTVVAEREALARLWEREAILSGSRLLVDCEEMESRDRLQTVIPFLSRIQSGVIVAGQEPLNIPKRLVIRLDVNPSSSAEQRNFWQQRLAPLTPELNGHLDRLVSQFHLGPTTIAAVSAEFNIQHSTFKTETVASSSLPAPVSTLHSLWDICRTQARPRLDDLAQRITPTATWDDLVLPPPSRQTLQEIAAQVRQRTTVYETWEFAVRGSNGLGISVLLAGASGTGKTMAAEVLANELRLDLYRIDLSQVVSKYIGETEKNLRRVFDAAETGGAILLFDEADALFGKRSEIKDSHDRYANIEVSYLLQRMEAYRGLAILTTNLKDAIDPAFLRRIRFVVQFPFPDSTQRMEIWRRIFPPKLPIEGLEFGQLARLNVAGGNIRNIALNAAFLAADAGEPVSMTHLLRAAQSEYAKLERPLTEAEAGGWI